MPSTQWVFIILVVFNIKKEVGNIGRDNGGEVASNKNSTIDMVIFFLYISNAPRLVIFQVNRDE